MTNTNFQNTLDTLTKCIDSGDYAPLYEIDHSSYIGSDPIDKALEHAINNRRAISFMAHLIASGVDYRIEKKSSPEFFSVGLVSNKTEGFTLYFAKGNRVNFFNPDKSRINAIDLFAAMLFDVGGIDNEVLEVKAAHARKAIKSGTPIDTIQPTLFLIAYEAMKEREERLALKATGKVRSPKTGSSDFVARLTTKMIENIRQN